jgi:hypothetical protein
MQIAKINAQMPAMSSNRNYNAKSNNKNVTFGDTKAELEKYARAQLEMNAKGEGILFPGLYSDEALKKKINKALSSGYSIRNFLHDLTHPDG